ncbi:MAG TPA: hypothetical protein VIM71_12925 [Lacunisphaera sp.]
MKRFLQAVLLIACLSPLAHAADKISTLVIHPEETIYARFEVSAKKIKLVNVAKEADGQAQVIFTLTREAKTGILELKVDNKFPNDLIYRAEIRSKTRNLHTPYHVTPVVGGKVAFEKLPPAVEEFAAFDFKLEK